ncbi:TPA: methyl-accepting chemotaxis protein [Enterobacter ludwigii]|nr:methyl-accepting chemotaxis protein [Enterobacter ludwigii]
MNITKRLTLCFSILIISLIATNTFSIQSFSRIGNDLLYFQKNTLSSLDIMNKEMLTVTLVRSQMYLHGLTQDATEMEKIKERTFQIYDELCDMQKKYISELVSDQHDLEVSKKTYEELKKFRSVMEQYFQLSEKNNLENITSVMSQDGIVGGTINKLVNDFTYQSNYNSLLVDKLSTSTNEFLKHSMIISIVFVFIAIAFLGVFGLLTVLNIRNRLNTMKNEMTSICEGLDFSRNIEIGRQDEIGLAIKAFNTLICRVSESLLLVRSASFSVSKVTDNLSNGNTELSTRTEAQAAAVIETAASMEELSSTVKQNAHNAHYASELAITASDNAIKGGDVVTATISIMKDISESSDRIAEITSVINDIAFQTNILALNAAVEAARAGEQGRGFAVVAGEVRSLAQRCGQASKEIKQLIEESVSLVNNGTHQADLAGKTMDNIVNSVMMVKDLMQEIAIASDEQNQGINQIAIAMNEMDTTTQHNAYLVQESSSSIASLLEQASTLNKMVDAFQLSHEKNYVPLSDENSQSRNQFTKPLNNVKTSWESF